MEQPHNEKNIPLVLTVAGSDPSGGAGIQGDIKSIQANGAFALSILTAVTAQNSLKMSATFDLPLWMIDAQMESILSDFQISAVKTGMLSSKNIIEHIVSFLKKAEIPHLVVDPVMGSKDGSPLLKPSAMDTLKSALIPLASLLTPNIPEAEALTGQKISTITEACEAARIITGLGCRATLVKGGHLLESPGCDVLFDGETITFFKGEFIDTPNTHGTGCTYSSAIATHLAFGKPLKLAITDAKKYITEAIRHGLNIGQGHGPTNHFYFLTPPISKKLKAPST